MGSLPVRSGHRRLYLCDNLPVHFRPSHQHQTDSRHSNTDTHKDLRTRVRAAVSRYNRALDSRRRLTEETDNHKHHVRPRTYFIRIRSLTRSHRREQRLPAPVKSPYTTVQTYSPVTLSITIQPEIHLQHTRLHRIFILLTPTYCCTS